MAGRQRRMRSPPPPSNSSPALPRHGPPEGNSSEAVVMETDTHAHLYKYDPIIVVYIIQKGGEWLSRNIRGETW